MSSDETTEIPMTQEPYAPTDPHFSGAYPPLGTYAPPYYTYTPPPDGTRREISGQPGHHPYVMAYAPLPGMVHAYLPPGQGFCQGGANRKQGKRKQVKMACTNCAAAGKRCDEARPCERCIKYGLSDQCQDGVRKERKKGIKRGPYKRKNKPGVSGDRTMFVSPEWQSSSQPGVAAAGTLLTATTFAATHTIAQFAPGPPPPGPEAHYPYYYPPPDESIPSPPLPGQDSHADGPQVQPGPNAVVQYFPVHPGGYAPFPNYLPYQPQQPDAVPPLPQQQRRQTMDPKKVNVAHRQKSGEESSPIPQALVPVPTSAPPDLAQSKKTRAVKTGGSQPKPKVAETKIGELRGGLGILGCGMVDSEKRKI